MCSTDKERLRLALIGCGAAAELVHLPALRRCSDVRVVLLVDKTVERAHLLADHFRDAGVSSDYHDVPARAEAAIVALPHHMHAPVAEYLLQQGVHVLIEKPMALTTTECDTIISAAEFTGSVLAVGLLRRFYPESVLVKRIIERGWLGSVRYFEFREGCVYDWPAASDFHLRPETGGGVLADTGAHVLDLLLWWLGDWSGVTYHDDVRGGVEADCELELELCSGARGIVEFSRTRNLSNLARIEGTDGSLEVSLDSWAPSLRLNRVAGCPSQDGWFDYRWQNRPTFAEVVRWQLEDFVEAIRLGRAPRVPGTEGRKAIALIESCYASRQLLLQPWMLPEEVPKLP